MLIAPDSRCAHQLGCSHLTPRPRSGGSKSKNETESVDGNRNGQIRQQHSHCEMVRPLWRNRFVGSFCRSFVRSFVSFSRLAISRTRHSLFSRQVEFLRPSCVCSRVFFPSVVCVLSPFFGCCCDAHPGEASGDTRNGANKNSNIDNNRQSSINKVDDDEGYDDPFHCRHDGRFGFGLFATAVISTTILVCPQDDCPTNTAIEMDHDARRAGARGVCIHACVSRTAMKRLDPKMAIISPFLLLLLLSLSLLLLLLAAAEVSPTRVSSILNPQTP